MVKSAITKPSTTARDADARRFLVALGERVRMLRERRGQTRKALSSATGVSERHLANLEYGDGNVSVLVLAEVAAALDCPLAELIGDFTTASPEALLIRSLLEGRGEDDLRRARIAIGEVLGDAPEVPSAAARIALIGLRGAGKSTLGARLAEHLDVPFVELSREIEQLAGCGIGEIQDLYGASAYRRHERRALDEVIRAHERVVVATPGGLVSDPANFKLLLSRFTTVWLMAEPEDHMQRVVAQGDFRPMAASDEAMADLRGILESRRDFYAKSDHRLDTSGQSLDATLAALIRIVETATGDPRESA